MSKALIVVDVQKDFCEGGSLAITGGAEVARRIAEVLRGNHGYDFVVATKDWHIEPGDHFSDSPDFIDSWPVHCVANTDGAEFHAELAPVLPKINEVFYKGQYAAAYSGFEGEAVVTAITLGEWLRSQGRYGVSAVDVVGLATDYCVKATALDASKHGFEVTVPLHLTAGVECAIPPRAVMEMVDAGVKILP